MRRLPLLGLLLAVIFSAQAGIRSSYDQEPARIPSDASTSHTGPTLTAALYYQTIQKRTNLPRLGTADIVVTVQQRQNERITVRRIHSFKAAAFRYVQAYWSPTDKAYDGIDLRQHEEWAFCMDGDTPLKGAAGGKAWYFLDANETGFRNAFLSQLKRIKRQGYDGVMFDRGYAALTGHDDPAPGIWNKSSTCTDHPIRPGGTFADGYVGLMRLVHRAGLKLILNTGKSPLHPDNRFRPNPRDTNCGPVAGPKCGRTHYGLEFVDYFLNEAPAHPRDAQWHKDLVSNRAAEQNKEFRNRVIGLITAGTLGGPEPKDNLSRANVFFQFARVRLFDVPVSVGTGDRPCKTDLPCNRIGVFPELTGVQFGPPLANGPTKSDCDAKIKHRCVWTRTYEGGVVLVNLTDEAHTVQVKAFRGADRTCRYVRDLYAAKVLADGKCTRRVAIELPPWSGRPIRVYPDGRSARHGL
jgi:hypothetical protein